MKEVYHAITKKHKLQKCPKMEKGCMCENSEKENYQNKIQSAELTGCVFILNTFCNNFYTDSAKLWTKMFLFVNKKSRLCVFL
jgi:hypothetical protein